MPTNRSTNGCDSGTYGTLLTSVTRSTPQLYVRELDQLAGVPLAGTEGAGRPFFSPDGAWIGFRDGSGGPIGPLKKVPAVGGASLTIAELDTQMWGASWGADDSIIYGTEGPGGLLRVAASGGEPVRLTTAEGSDIYNSTEVSHRLRR